jgi:hypothetical protein
MKRIKKIQYLLVTRQIFDEERLLILNSEQKIQKNSKNRIFLFFAKNHDFFQPCSLS